MKNAKHTPAPFHTPAPWAVDSDRTGACTIGTRAVEVARLDTENGDRDFANARRICACVNALEGVKDPSRVASDLAELAALVYAATTRLNGIEHHAAFVKSADARVRELLSRSGRQ